MSHLQPMPDSEKPKKLSKVKDKDERRFMISDAVQAFRTMSRVKREIKDIREDPELVKAAKEVLRKEIADRKAELKTI